MDHTTNAFVAMVESQQHSSRMLSFSNFQLTTLIINSCDWCMTAANSTDVDPELEAFVTGMCSSVGVTIAPIPASYLSQLSAWNSSSLAAAGGSGTGLASTLTKTTGSSGSTKTAKSAASTPTNTPSKAGGSTSAPAPSSSAAPSSATGAVKTGGAQGWRYGEVLLFAVAMLSGTAFYLL